MKSEPEEIVQSKTDQDHAAPPEEPPRPVDERPQGEPQVVVPPDVASQPVAPPPSTATPQPTVHVARDLPELIRGLPEEEEATQAAQEQRDLNEVVHGVLILGLAVSTALMLFGLVLALAQGRDLPTAVPNLTDVVTRVAQLRPSGFLALGLVVLIATPILRVFGSILAFAYERDWRFTGITTIVLVVVIISVVLGKG